MVSELLQNGADIGVSRVSLNFAMFRSAFEQGAHSAPDLWPDSGERCSIFFSRWWQLETLYRSNMKYQPQWVPATPASRTHGSSPGRCRLGDRRGFLVPAVLRRKRRHTGHHSAVPKTSWRPESSMPTGRLRTTSAVCSPNDSDRRRPRAGSGTSSDGEAENIAGKGIDPYPVANPPSHSVAEALAIVDDDHVTVTLAGRILRIRDYGGVLFSSLRDWTGDIQLLLDRAVLDGAATDFASVDLGDLVEVTGTMGYSKNGTRSLLVKQWRMLGKCLRPLPDKWKV